MKIEKGLSLNVIIKELFPLLIKLEMPKENKPYLIKRLAEIEYRLSLNCSDNIQLGSLIGAFNEIRHINITK